MDMETIALTPFGSLMTVICALWSAGRILLRDPAEGMQGISPSRVMLVSTVAATVLLIAEGLFPAPLFAWAEQELHPLLLGGL